MPANTSSIDLTSLDFNSQKASLKNYLRNQDIFKDFDFDGSNMSVLIDLLSYNTFKNAFYTNMLMSESFLDTAQLRGSVISHAKELNYTPRSAKSSRAKVRVDFEATSESQPYIIQKGQTLSAIVKNTNFIYSIPETISVSSSNNSFSFETDIFEGVYVKDTYVFKQPSDEIPTFKITNKNIDIESLTVVVYEDGAIEGTIYTLTDTLLDLNFQSKVFFLQCNENEYYEVYFGDNVLGQKPKEYSTIVLDYRVSSGPAADGALEFVLNFNPTGNESELTGTFEVTTLDVSKGGQNPETTESIRYYAPRNFQVQERMITTEDYEVALKIQFPEINAVYAYGGEDVDPPMYGRVFVAVDISNVEGFPDSKKREYYNFTKRRIPFSIEPIFVSPEYSYLSLDVLVRYNVNITKVSTETIKTIVMNAIMNYRDENLNDFNVVFRNSKLARDIDDSDVSIVSSLLDVHLYKKVDIQPGIKQDITLDFSCALKDDLPLQQDIHPSSDLHTFYSSPFRYGGQTCMFEDDGDGKIRLVKTDGTTDTKITNVGTIDYSTGKISMSNIQIDTFLGDAVKFYVKTKDIDVSTQRNTILDIESNEVDIVVETLRL